MLLVTLLVLALVLSFLLSGMESALLSVSRVRVRHAADAGDQRAVRMLRLLEDREGVLGALAVVNHIANVTSFGIIAWGLVQQLGAWGYGVAFLAALPLFIVVLEMLPKDLCRRFPYRALRRLMPLLSVVGAFRQPFNAMSELPSLAEEESAAQRPGARREDLRAMISSAKPDLLPGDAAGLLLSVLDLSELRAEHVMVPLAKLVAVGEATPLATALQLARQHDVLCLPVLSDKALKGYVGLLDTSAVPTRPPADRNVHQHMRSLDFVDAKDTALAVLQRLRLKGISMAMVRDHTAGNEPCGIITEEDLVAELLRPRGAAATEPA